LVQPGKGALDYPALVAERGVSVFVPQPRSSRSSLVNPSCLPLSKFRLAHPAAQRLRRDPELASEITEPGQVQLHTYSSMLGGRRRFRPSLVPCVVQSPLRQKRHRMRRLARV
jgi:hypothetical protein